MYIPEHFEEKDTQRIRGLIESHPLGMLVTVQDGSPCVNHMPFLFDPDANKLLGHMARANEQWRHLADVNEILVVFQGPNAYVSPSWYASPGVPTWNYAVVHIYGSVSLIEDEALVGSLVGRQTLAHESGLQAPWNPDLADERRTKLLNMIVGFEIEISRFECKFKLSQNRPLEDRCRVAAAFGTDTEISRLMAGMGDSSGQD